MVRCVSDLARQVDEKDAGARDLVLSDAGKQLMFDTFEIIESIEERFISTLESDSLTGLRTVLAAHIGIRHSS